MFKVVRNDGACVGLVSTREDAERIVAMRLDTGKGGALKADRSNAAECAKATYTIEAGARHPSGVLS